MPGWEQDTCASKAASPPTHQAHGPEPSGKISTVESTVSRLPEQSLWTARPIGRDNDNSDSKPVRYGCAWVAGVHTGRALLLCNLAATGSVQRNSHRCNRDSWIPGGQAVQGIDLYVFQVLLLPSPFRAAVQGVLQPQPAVYRLQEASRRQQSSGLECSQLRGTLASHCLKCLRPFDQGALRASSRYELG